MYESEIYYKKEKLSSIPQYAIEKALQLREKISFKSVLYWSEHCTECAVPQCYSTCKLYEQRIDGKCQRFNNGIKRIEMDSFYEGYFIKLSFARWGKLSAQANTRLFDMLTAQLKDAIYTRRTNRIAEFSPGSVLRNTIYSYNKLKAKFLTGFLNKTPDSFLVEYFNPSEKLYDFSIRIKNDGITSPDRIFNHRAILEPGYSTINISFNEIKKFVDTGKTYRIDIIPNNLTPDNMVYFGITDFIITKPKQLIKQQKKKCVVWDLDNTLWQGILVEDGKKSIKLNDEFVDLVKQLDELGIINSIASKNNPDEINEILDEYKIREYFVNPKISWEPKSKSISEIAAELNIATNTFVIIDDSPFERAEIKTEHPDILAITPEDALLLPYLEGINKTVTEESKNRRSYYKDTEKRNIASSSFEGSYNDFLRSTNLQLTITKLSEENFDRVVELTYRTNQLNFSGKVYTESMLAEIQKDNNINAFVLSAADKFGKYGIIGFALHEIKANTLRDLIFSCRVMGKYIEHTFIGYLASKFHCKDNPLKAYYLETERNKINGKVFQQTGFSVIKENKGLKIFQLTRKNDFRFADIVSIIES